MKFQGLVFGIPREILSGERRVSATPDTVKKMIEQGATVLVEQQAGVGSYFNDQQYQEAGATLVADVEEIYGKADVILKVKEPKFNGDKNKHEVEMMHSGQCLVTFLHPASPSNHKMIENLAQQGVLSFTLDSIPRITRAQSMDALTSMSTVAGYKGLLMAATRLPKFMCMIGTAVGMIQPAKVLVVGAGVAGLQSIATGKRLGAVVSAVDIRPDACEQAKSLGAKIIDVDIPVEVAVGHGGYANKLPAQWLEKERAALKEVVADSDIVILTALVPGKRAPIIITEEMVSSMKNGSCIVDISIDQGGNCELAKPGQVLEQHGVIIDGTQNIPGTVPTSSTSLFAKNIFNYITNLIDNGQIQTDKPDEIVQATLVTKAGKIVHEGTLEAMSLS